MSHIVSSNLRISLKIVQYYNLDRVPAMLNVRETLCVT